MLWHVDAECELSVPELLALALALLDESEALAVTVLEEAGLVFVEDCAGGADDSPVHVPKTD
jgi:hypothetical protein